MSKLLKCAAIEVDKNQVVYHSDEAVRQKTASGTAKDSRAEAKQIISEARAAADGIRRIVEKRAKETLEAAKESGFREGYKAGSETARKENEAALGEITELLKSLDNEKKRIYTDNKQDIIDLAFKIAEKVINKKLTADSDTFIKLYEKAVKDLTAQKWLKLTVADCDVQIVTSNSDYLLSMVGGAERLEVEVKEGALRGTCIVETSEKIVDASVYTQIKLLKEAVVNAE